MNEAELKAEARELFKQQAEPELTYMQALTVVARRHGYRNWQGFRAAVRVQKVEAWREERQRAAASLSPEQGARRALRKVLPAPWRDALPNDVRRVYMDLYKPAQMLLSGASVPVPLLPNVRLTHEDFHALYSRVPDLNLQRTGLSGTYVVLHSLKDEAGYPSKVTISLYDDQPAVAESLGDALDANLLVTAVPGGLDHLGPWLRGIARRKRDQGQRVEVIEDRGSVTGRGHEPGPGLEGIRRTLTDNVARAVRERLAQRDLPDVLIVGEVWEREDIEALAACPVQLIVGAIGRPADLPYHPSGPLLMDPALFPTRAVLSREGHLAEVLREAAS